MTGDIETLADALLEPGFLSAAKREKIATALRTQARQNKENAATYLQEVEHFSTRAEKAESELTDMRAAMEKLNRALCPQYEPPDASQIFENLDRYELHPLAVAEFRSAAGLLEDRG